MVHDHLCDTWLPTFETLSFFAYWRLLTSVLVVSVNPAIVCCKSIDSIGIKFFRYLPLLVNNIDRLEPALNSQNFTNK